ncbi:small heat shock protein [Moniliophthora roreri]|nr:small heat shock protein [Moniliophthora roreri]
MASETTESRSTTMTPEPEVKLKFSASEKRLILEVAKQLARRAIEEHERQKEKLKAVESQWDQADLWTPRNLR